jgi:hypothetical protein
MLMMAGPCELDGREMALTFGEGGLRLLSGLGIGHGEGVD